MKKLNQKSIVYGLAGELKSKCTNVFVIRIVKIFDIRTDPTLHFYGFKISNLKYRLIYDLRYCVRA